jgi:hypothetical protein
VVLNFFSFSDVSELFSGVSEEDSFSHSFEVSFIISFGGVTSGVTGFCSKVVSSAGTFQESSIVS